MERNAEYQKALHNVFDLTQFYEAVWQFFPVLPRYVLQIM